MPVDRTAPRGNPSGTEAPTSRYRLGYRGDIEGLRAVAILLVVAAHAKVRWLAGGFVGVDVFYVLSGYLITGLLVQEIRTTGSLRFADFYARRLRRLLPAMLLMIGISGVLGWLLLAPGEQAAQASAAAAASLWLSNFHFAFQRMDYFAPGSETNLFLHTWSLGVEEQFYLVWPLLLVLAMGAWRAARRTPDARRLAWSMLLVLVAGFALAWYWTYAEPQLAFYMMPARAWQFALGALVFLGFGAPAFDSGMPFSRKQNWLRAAAWLGLAMIVAAALLLDNRVPYPGWWAWLPSAGAALVIAAGGHGAIGGVDRLLSLRPMQAIGRVSYAWYLWHWPVLLLGAAVIDIADPWNRLGLVLLSLAIAALSFHFFESPLRRQRRLVARPRMAVFASLALMLLAGSVALRWQTVAMLRMQGSEQLPYQLARVDAPVIYGMGCDDWYHSADVHACAFGNAKAEHTAVAMGDSVGLQWFPAYARVFDRPGWRLLVITKSSCPMVDVPIFYARIGREYTECAQWRNRALQDLATLKPDLVILGSTFTADYTQDQWQQGTRRVLQRLSASAGRVYVMRSTPTLPFDGPSCLAPRSKLYEWLTGPARCTAALADATRFNDVYRWLQAAAAPFPNVRMVDMTPEICPQGICRASLDGKIVFRDFQHLTASFAESLGPALAGKLGMAMPAADASGDSAKTVQP
ncbi:MAG: acyltransferase [Proteobacteria bacterium]|nr:acyltransferase [Pseudomonadota bacterium]